MEVKESIQKNSHTCSLRVLNMAATSFIEILCVHTYALLSVCSSSQSEVIWRPHGIHKQHLYVRICTYTQSGLHELLVWHSSHTQLLPSSVLYTRHMLAMRSLIYCTQAKLLYCAATTSQVLSRIVGCDAHTKKQQHLSCTKSKPSGKPSHFLPFQRLTEVLQ